MGDGDSVPLGEAASALRNSRNSAPVRVGKKGVEWAIMSVRMCSLRLKRIPSPRGIASGLVSGIWGSPVELEKRRVTGVEGLLKWAAVESSLALGMGVKVPLSIKPLVWAVGYVC